MTLDNARKITSGEYRPMMIQAWQRIIIEEHEKLQPGVLCLMMGRLMHGDASDDWIKFHSYVDLNGQRNIVLSAVV